MLSKEEQETLQQLCKTSPEAAKVCELLHKEQQLQLSMVSHEIRNPVTLINSFLQLIGAAHPEVKEHPHWEDVMYNIHFLRFLLTQLSDYNNSRKLNRTEINIYRMLQSFINSVRTSLSDQNIQITFQKNGPVPPFLLDREKMTQVFLNLFRNAAEALGENGGEIKVTLTSDCETVTVSIRDNGPGIPEEYLPTLFDFFVTHKKEGTGLGLAICKNIVEAHNGTIKAISTPGEGAEFVIELPILYR